MRHRSVIAAILAASLAAAFYLRVGRTPLVQQSDPLSSIDVEIAGAIGGADSGGSVRAGSSMQGTAAALEIRNLSPTFRNSTFLIAIRGDGFYCDEVTAAHETANGVWLASCTEKLGYTLDVIGVDEFDVRPVAHYFDSVSPSPQLREQLNRGPPPGPLDFERLRQ
jgi:hypothetical protein